VLHIVKWFCFIYFSSTRSVEYSMSHEEFSDASDNDYSDDFDDENSPVKGATKQKSSSTHIKQKPQKSNTDARESATAATVPEYVQQQTSGIVNPAKESLARSLLASQELFRTQLESLRARIQATNDYTNAMQAQVNRQWTELNNGSSSSSSSSSGGFVHPFAPPPQGAATAASAGFSASRNTVPVSFSDRQNIAGATSGIGLRSSFQPAPSLDEIKSQLQQRKASSTFKMLDLLGQIYPSISEEDVRKLVEKI
jgi:hypothetical protein